MKTIAAISNTLPIGELAGTAVVSGGKQAETTSKPDVEGVGPTSVVAPLPGSSSSSSPSILK